MRRVSKRRRAQRSQSANKKEWLNKRPLHRLAPHSSRAYYVDAASLPRHSLLGFISLLCGIGGGKRTSRKLLIFSKIPDLP